MLTHIDQIKSHPNVLLLTTSNITGAIDAAFLDRADIKQYLGLPGEEAIFKIYLSCLRELVKVQEQNSFTINKNVNTLFLDASNCF